MERSLSDPRPAYVAASMLYSHSGLLFCTERDDCFLNPTGGGYSKRFGAFSPSELLFLRRDHGQSSNHLPTINSYSYSSNASVVVDGHCPGVPLDRAVERTCRPKMRDQEVEE